MAVVCLLNCPTWSGTPAQANVTKKLKLYPTRYYDIYSDLSSQQVMEAATRMTCLAEEYYRRTAGFARSMPKKMPFYLFSNREDYITMSGLPKSAGVFTGKSLMADGSYGDQLWHIVQHEAFHQFAASAITPRLPIWMNEGMAEYFGESIWTGDNFFTGVVPPGRLARVKSLIDGKKLLRFSAMIEMTPQQWVTDLKGENYDQAWSMMHFLVHGDDGKYQKAFAQCINEMARGMSIRLSFVKYFGDNTNAFQDRYEQWWKAQGEDSSAEVYTKAYLAVLTSAMARAHVSGQTFTDFAELLAAIKDKTLKDSTNQFIPQGMIQIAAREVPARGDCTLEYLQKKPRLTLLLADQTKFVGTFIGKTKAVASVDVTVIKPKPAKTGKTNKTATKSD
jgi:hypothetical protein